MTESRLCGGGGRKNAFKRETLTVNRAKETSLVECLIKYFSHHKFITICKSNTELSNLCLFAIRILVKDRFKIIVSFC